jgi:ankyrin repeat protein
VLLDRGLHPDWHGTSAAPTLAYCKSPRAVQLLLDAGADVTLLTALGMNCLHYAAHNGAPVSVLCAMIAAGADPTLVSFAGV